MLMGTARSTQFRSIYCKVINSPQLQHLELVTHIISGNSRAPNTNSAKEMSKPRQKKHQMPSGSREDGHSRTENNDHARGDLQTGSLEEEISSSPPARLLPSEESFVTTRQSAKGGNSVLEAQGLPDSEPPDASPFKAIARLNRTPTLVLPTRPAIPSSKEKERATSSNGTPSQRHISSFFSSMKSPVPSSILPLSALPQAEALEALASAVQRAKSALPLFQASNSNDAIAAQNAQRPSAPLQEDPEGPLFSSSVAQLQHAITTAVTKSRGAHHEDEPFNDPHLLGPPDPHPLITQTQHEILLEQLQKQNSSDPAIILQIQILKGSIEQSKTNTVLQQIMQQQQWTLRHQADLLKQYRGTESEPVLIPSTTPGELQSSTSPTSDERTIMRTLLLQSQQRQVKPVTSQQSARAGVLTSHLYDPGNPPSANFTRASSNQPLPPDQLESSRLGPADLTSATMATDHATHLPRDPLEWLAAAQQQSRMSQRIKAQQHATIKQEQTQAAREARLTHEAARRREVEDAQDQALILGAQKRIAERQSAPIHQRKLTFKVKKPAAQSEAALFAQERRIARLTDDKEYLRHGSERCKKEKLSDDERTDILAELDQQQASHLLFNPKATVPRSKHGYVTSNFVANDSESPDHFDDQLHEEEEGDFDDSYETDGDPSSDYRPSNSPSGSRSPQHRVRTTQFSSAEWQEYQQLKRAASTTPAPSRTRSSAPSAGNQLTMNISVAEPPEHGEWRDIHFLTTTFRDRHDYL